MLHEAHHRKESIYRKDLHLTHAHTTHPHLTWLTSTSWHDISVKRYFIKLKRICVFLQHSHITILPGSSSFICCDINTSLKVYFNLLLFFQKIKMLRNKLHVMINCFSWERHKHPIDRIELFDVKASSLFLVVAVTKKLPCVASHCAVSRCFPLS